MPMQGLANRSRVIFDVKVRKFTKADLGDGVDSVINI